jgi:hypothetical protein
MHRVADAGLPEDRQPKVVTLPPTALPKGERPILGVLSPNDLRGMLVTFDFPETVLALALADSLPLAAKPVEVGRARTVASDMKVYGAKLVGSVAIGRFTFESPELRFHAGLPVNVGAGILEDFQVTLDATQRRVRLARAGS